MQMQQRPVSVGFFFAMGHSDVVVLVAAPWPWRRPLWQHVRAFHAIGGDDQHSVSALFLLAIAAMNIIIFGLDLSELSPGTRRWRPTSRRISTSFSTVGACCRGFSVRCSAGDAKLAHVPARLPVRSGLRHGDRGRDVRRLRRPGRQRHAPSAAILVFPVLFAAGMSLVDTTDGVMMLGAYEWAFVKPMRKLYYNMTITLVSSLVALLIGGIEALGLIADQFGLKGRFWDAGWRAQRQFQ